MEVRVTERLYGALIAVVVANVGLTVTLLKLLQIWGSLTPTIR